MPDKRNLTDRTLRALTAPPGERLMVWDAGQPGLAVRVTDKGKRTFTVVGRAKGDRRLVKKALGVYPDMSLAEAREKTREALALLLKGQRPREVEAARLREEARRRADTFEAVAEEFCRELEAGRVAKVRGKGRLRNPGATAAVVRRELIPAWKKRPVTEIEQRDVVEVVRKIRARAPTVPEAGRRRTSGGPYAARHALAAARRLFDWAIDGGVLTASPCERIKAARVHGAPEDRARVLTDDELRAVWRAAEATAYPFGPLVKLLMLTGQRRGEIAGARWREIDLDRPLLTVPVERMKGGIAHTVPLTPEAVTILHELPRFGGGDFVFSTSGGDRPFSGFSKAKARLDNSVAAEAPWTLHDIRRSVRTGLSSLGVLPVIAELTIGHKQQGIAAVYDRHRYDAEKRDALARWEARLLMIVSEPEPGPSAASDNVVPLRARRRA